MVAFSNVMAASSLIALTLSAPIRNMVPRKAFAGYKVYGGDGTTAQGWPAESDWWSFDDLWEANLDTLSVSCTQFPGSPPNNSPTEIAAIKKAILDGAQKTGVKSQFILAFMMQESKGCVRAPTTAYENRNPGLMQCFNGKGTCNENGFTTPCPDSTISLMIDEGLGIGLDFGIQQAIQKSGSTGVDKYYKASRIYNSGSIAPSGNLGGGVATHCYSSDIANRLQGWVTENSKSSCSEGSIGSIGGSASGNGGSNTTPSPPTSEPPAAAPPAAAPPAAAPSKSATPSNNGGANTSAPIAPGAAANCKSWYTVQAGDSCASTGVSFDTLKQLNTAIDGSCSNLWAGYRYCTGA